MNNDKAVLIIGNGFDLELKRETKYSDFYNSGYCPKWYPAPLIAYLNNWTEDNQSTDIRWMDLENAIQDYAKDRGKDKPFPVHYTEEEFALIKKLYDYDITPNQNDHYKFSGNETKLLERMKEKHKIVFEKPTDSYITFPNVISDMEDFNAYLNSIKEYESLRSFEDEESKSRRSELLKKIAERDRKALSEIENKFAQYLSEKVDCSVLDNENNIAYNLLKRFLCNYPNGEIYSFNYTPLDKLIEKIEQRPGSHKNRIKYMHGSIDNHVIIGAGIKKTNDEYGEWDFLMKTRDDNYHIPPLMYNNIMNANIVFIYGLSLGEIDIQYFNDLFDDIYNKKTHKTVVLCGRNIQNLKNNIKNIDTLQRLGVNVISCQGNENNPSLWDEYLVDRAYPWPQTVI